MQNSNSSMAFSLALHLLLFAIIIYGLPSITSTRDLTDSSVITVDILPVSEFTNVKRIKPKPVAKPIKKEVSAAVQPKLSMAEPAKDAVITPPEPIKRKPEERVIQKAIEPIIKPEPAPKIEPTKKPVIEKPKVAEKPEEALGAAFKSVEEMFAGEGEVAEEESVDFSEIEDMLAPTNDSQPEYKPGLPMTVSEKDAIIQQIHKNWTILSGAKGAKDMLVVINITLARDGTVIKHEMENKLRYNTDEFYRALVDSGVRAIYKSSPLKNLPPEKYDVKDGWREIQVNFDPSEILY